MIFVDKLKLYNKLIWVDANMAMSFQNEIQNPFGIFLILDELGSVSHLLTF